MKKSNKLLRVYYAIFALFLFNVGYASDIVEVLPLTDQIVMLHFNDGYVTHHKLGESRSSDVLHSNPLNLDGALQTSAYQLISMNDGNYSQLRNPVKIGRKTKGIDFTMNTAWDSNWRNNSWVCDHWIYLYLPEKMQTGKSYTLSTGALAANSNSFTFTYDEKILRSEAVHVNQVGYLPTAQKKFGYVYYWAGDQGGLDLASYTNKNFWLIDANTGNIEFAGQLKFRKSADNQETYQSEDTPNSNFINADVYECDFSTFNRAGKYRLAVEGIGCSFPFSIGEDIYRSSFKTTVRGLYHNRSGIELTSEYTEFTRPAPHNVNLTSGFGGKLHYSTVRSCDTQNDGGDNNAIKALVESGDKGTINTWGWYQDAGDWDGYPSHLRIPAWLMLAYELNPKKFVDNELNIPGKNNGIPDILDEARWLIEYLHRTRHAIMDAGYGTGGVSGRVCGDYWGGDIADENSANGSWGDMRTWYVFGEDPMNTYMYSGLAAEYAYLLKLSGKVCPTGINWEQEAIDAYNWSESNTRPGDDQAPYAVISLKDTRMYAAANLYKLTGKNIYHVAFIKDTESINADMSIEDRDTRFSIYSYLLLEDSRTLPDVVARLKSVTANTSQLTVSMGAGMRACRWGGNPWMPMLTGHGTTPWVIDAFMNYRVNNNASSLTDAITTVDYFMGNNPMNHIWFTGEKADIINPERRYVKGIFHMDSWYNTNHEDREVPGYAPYGPWRQERNLTPNPGDGGANNGWWCNEWSYNAAYPVMQDNPHPIDNSATAWPGHERWFNPRYAPLAAENTVWQSTVHWAIATGLLCADITSNPFDVTRLPAAEPYDESGTEEDDSRILMADFDNKVLYSDFSGAPDGTFKIYATLGVDQPVDNPDKTDPNLSDKVMKIVKNAGTWQLFGLESKQGVSFDISDFSRFDFKVKGNVQELYVQIPNAAEEGNIIDSRVTCSLNGEWSAFSLDISGHTGSFTNINIFPNPEIEENGATFYFDDFILYKNIPESPIALTASNIGESTFTLSWNAPANVGIEKYLVYRSAPGDTVPNVICGETTTNSIEVSNLELGASYYFAVKAVGTNGLISALSTSVSVNLVLTSMVVADFDTKILYDWASIESAPTGSFMLYSGEQVDQPVDNPDKTGVNKSDKVMKFAKSGTGTWKLFGLETQGKKGIEISHFSRFVFKVKGNVQEIYVQIVNSADDHIVDTRVPFVVNGEWKLFSLDISGKNGAFTNVNIFPNPEAAEDGAAFYFDDIAFYDESYVETPVNLSVSSIGETSLTLAWDPVSTVAIDKYQVYRSAPGGGVADIYCGDVTGNSMALTGLESGEVYSFAVRAISVGGYASQSSEPISVTLYSEVIVPMVIADFDNTILYDWFSIEYAPDGSFRGYSNETIENPVDNPDVTSVNNSQKVMKFTKNGTGTWKLFGMESKNTLAYDISEFVSFEFKVKGNVRDLYIQFPSKEGGNIIDPTISATTNGEWTQFNLDISGNTGNFSNINIFPSPNIAEDGAVYYFDDFKLNRRVSQGGTVNPAIARDMVTSVGDTDISNVFVYPTFITSGNSVSIGGIENAEDVKVTLYNLQGSILKQETLFPYSSLIINENPGIYLIEMEISGQKKTQRLIVY
ncbi:MAG: fibronectin type III domain-containing protein [Bacteroidales bacterium]|nr:fibronectin type III domain-containing protein [Bacteroidales bacterium]